MTDIHLCPPMSRGLFYLEEEEKMKRVLMMWGMLLLLMTPSWAWAAETDDVKARAGNEDASVVRSGTETEGERGKVYMKIGEITVTEKADYLTTADAPASVDVIGSDQIEIENVDFSMELLKKVPGFYYGDWNQGVTSGMASLRGFDNNHDSPVGLIVDGIPHNLGGSMDIQPFFPLEIERIEVVKGTIDPRYGLLNIAGNINLHTKQGGNFTKAKLLTGSYSTYDASIITGHEENGFSQTYFAGYRQTDGYREHSDIKKGAASGKWFYTSEDQKFSIGAIARAFGMDANAPGYITKAESESNPTKYADFSYADGGERENQDIGTHLDYAFSDQLIWSFKTYYQHRENTRWSRWSWTGSQRESYSDNDQYGAISTFSYEIKDTFIPRLAINWGLDYQHDNDVTQTWAAEDRVRQGDPTRYYDQSWYYWGTYVQADGDINDWLRLTSALRVDSFDGEMTNQLTGLTTDMVDMDYIWQPKAGFIITPLDGYNFYGNYGRSFQTPGTPTLYGQSTSGTAISSDVSYSKNDGWELGIKASPKSWLSARIDYWQMTATDEVREKGDGSLDLINAGETDRKGWDFSLSVRPHKWVSVWGSYSVIEAKYTEPGPTYASIKGNDIENVPEFTSKVGMDFTHPSGFFSNIWLEIQGDYYVDSANLVEKDGAYNILNGSIGYKWKKATIGLDIKNVFDTNYCSFVWYNDSGYNPGDGRSAYLWVSLDF